MTLPQLAILANNGEMPRPWRKTFATEAQALRGVRNNRTDNAAAQP